MEADIIKRVVRAIAERSQTDLERLALRIVQGERKVGHNKLADQLDAILNQPRPRTNGGNALAALPDRSKDRNLFELPLSRRNGDSLATLVAPDKLEHHMVVVKASRDAAKAAVLQNRRIITEANVREAIAELPINGHKE